MTDLEERQALQRRNNTTSQSAFRAAQTESRCDKPVLNLWGCINIKSVKIVSSNIYACGY